MSNIEKEYGVQHQVGHRSNLAGSLYAECQKYSAITFNFSISVESVESFGPRPSFTTLSRGSTQSTSHTVDILLGADGIKSRVRTSMLAALDISAKIVDTEQAAYRIMLTRDQMAHDPELLELIDSNRVTRWIGEKRHIISYPVSANTVFNISTAHPDTHFAAAPSATYTTRGEKKAVFEVYKEFGTLVHKLLDLVPEGEVCEWKLRVHEPLPYVYCHISYYPSKANQHHH